MRLLQRQVLVATSRPTLSLGDIDQQVGVLQQKLNALGESLVIDAEFGSRTRAAVIRFQRAHSPLRVTGNVNADTWTTLDGLISGGEAISGGALSPVIVNPRPSSAGHPHPNTDVKPELRLGSRGLGAAVAELHEKLNQHGASLPTAVSLAAANTLEFTAATDTAVRDFQRGHPPLIVDGIVGRRTWAALDASSRGSTMGRTDQFVTERARGMTFGTHVSYDWALEPDRVQPARLRIRIGYDYQEDPTRPLPDRGATVNQLLNGIRSVWNVFKAVERPTTPGARTRPDVQIEFDPQPSAPANQRIQLSSGSGPSTSVHYFITPGLDLVALSAHEFGHQIGLDDEYQQTAADHLRQTGEVAQVGDWQGDGTHPEVIARELASALRTPPRATHGDRALAVIRAHGVTQGAFAQRVAHRYLRTFGISIVADCNRLIDEDPSEGPLTRQRLCSHPFLYNEDNLMGGAESLASTHRHDVAPRHVRHLCALIAQAMGGTWEPANR